MRRHAASHSMAVLITTVTAYLIAYTLRTLIPAWIEALEGVAQGVLTTTSLPMSKEALAVMLIAGLLGIIWGIGFHLAHEDQYEGRTA